MSFAKDRTPIAAGRVRINQTLRNKIASTVRTMIRACEKPTPAQPLHSSRASYGTNRKLIFFRHASIFAEAGWRSFGSAE
jgi:hypothetical protein